MTQLSWFRAWKRTEWKVGTRREAHTGGTGPRDASGGRGGRYRIERRAEDGFVSFCPPRCGPDEPWEEIGRATTELTAIVLAQAHADLSVTGRPHVKL
jgi:hypothetical protein